MNKFKQKISKVKQKFSNISLKSKLLFYTHIHPRINKLPQPVVQQLKLSHVYLVVFFITYKILNNFYGIGPYNYYAMNRKYFVTENVSISVDSLGSNVKHSRMVKVGKINKYLDLKPPESYKGYAVVLTDDNKGLGVDFLINNGVLNDLLSYGYSPLVLDWPGYGGSPEFTEVFN